MTAITFVVVVDQGEPERLRARVAEHAQVEREWLTARRFDIHTTVSPSKRRAALAELAIEYRRRRDAGELRGTQTGLMSYFVRDVLTANGWDGWYPDVPEGLASLAGRPVGRGTLDEERPEVPRPRLAVDLAPELADQVRRAAYWVSEPAVRELLAWADRFGPGPADEEVGLAAEFGNALGLGPRARDMRRRAELRGQILTTGDIIRYALARAIA